MNTRLANTDIDDLQVGVLTDYSHKRIDPNDAAAIYSELMDTIIIDRLSLEQEVCAMICDALFREAWGEAFIRDHTDNDISKVTRLASDIINKFTKVI